jgi:hypothetical protein
MESLPKNALTWSDRHLGHALTVTGILECIVFSTVSVIDNNNNPNRILSKGR